MIVIVFACLSWAEAERRRVCVSIQGILLTSWYA